jgi:O-antigen/teichoic acid export membrane protein
VTANGEAIRATMVYRLLLPVSVVVSVGAAVLLIDELTAVQAIVCYGLGWIVSLVVIIRLTFKTTRHEVRSSGKMYAPRSWIGRSVPFLLRSVMMTQFASLPIIVLKLGSHDQQIVGTYAACMQTAGFIVLVATATNRFYSPKAAVLIDRKDYHGMKETIRERHAWLRPVILFYLLAMVLFGKPILGLYGEAFVAGYPALLLIAAGSAIGVAFSMAPFYLQFVGQNKLVLGITTAAGLLNIGLLFPLADRWGATGAAAAYAISLGAMSIAFRVLALRGVNRTLDELEAREAGASS